MLLHVFSIEIILAVKMDFQNVVIIQCEMSYFQLSLNDILHLDVCLLDDRYSLQNLKCAC